jgi:hypothetical protein
MTTQQVDAALAAANPIPDPVAASLELRGAELELIEQIVTTPVGSHPRARSRRSDRFRKVGMIPRWSMAAVAAVAAACVVLIGPFSSSTPTVAQAFPALNAHAALTPASLQRALEIYGVGPANAGLNIRQGHPVYTPWGAGYVLTNPDRSFICVVAPASDQQAWGASCARTNVATRAGTAVAEYSYDKTTNTARFLTLLPAGATATAQLPGGRTQPLPVHDGVVAFVVHQPVLVKIHVGDHVNVIHLIPSDAVAATPPAGSTGGSQSTTTSAGSPAPSSR